MTGTIAGNLLNILRGEGLAGCCNKWLFLFGAVFFSFAAHAQAINEADYEPISVSLEVKDVGNADIPAVYFNKEVYPLITGVFDVIKIKNTASQSLDTITGFFQNEQDPFIIDNIRHRIFYQHKTFDLKPGDLVRIDANLYLNLKYFDAVFGLEGIFYFRRLVVAMTSKTELPVIREMRQEQMRKNVNRLRGDVKADTVVKRTHPLFHFGMADWAIMSAQQSEGQDQTTLNLGLGGVVAGGEANASLNYYSQSPFNEKLQYYQWRYVNNDNPALRQVVAGKIFAQATASLYAPVVGIQFTNAPTIYRKSYGTYTLSQTTEPGWVVELYVNDVLVDYKKSDASGFYSFEVPLIYGYTIIKLRFYGPYGEERTSMQYINIPFNFLPAHEFEYAASAGVVEDDKNSRYSRVGLNYGVSSHITFGGGVEYLSSVTSGTTMPFVNTSMRITPRLLLSGEYTYGVRARGVLSYRFPSALQLDLDYTKFDKGQTAIYYNYLEERKAVISIPLHRSTVSVFTRLTLDQISVPQTKYTNAEWAFTGSLRGVGLNLSTYASFVKSDIPYIYSIVSLSFQLPAKIMFTSQVQYDYKENTPVFMKYTFEKRMLGNGFFNVGYQQYFNANNLNILVGMRYDFSFARVALSAITGNNNYYSRVEAASGSLIYDHKSNYLNANNRTNVGKGGVVLKPFLDINCNGKRDPGEPGAPGVKIRVNGGRIIYSEKDTNIRILDLEPYNTYLVELNGNGFDNIAWRLKKRSVSVTVNPNNFTLIDIPVSVVGEVSGVVTNKNAKNKKGLGQITILIYDEEQTLVAKTLTESDGFFSYIGLAPGDYIAKLDSAQLKKLNLTVTPQSIPVHFEGNREGDIVDGLEFSITSLFKDTLVNTSKDTLPALRRDTVAVSHIDNDRNKNDGKPVVPVVGQTELPSKHILAHEGSFVIRLGTYKNRAEAVGMQGQIRTDLHLNVTTTREDSVYILQIIGFKTRNEARLYIDELIYEGYNFLSIRKLKEDIVE